MKLRQRENRKRWEADRWLPGDEDEDRDRKQAPSSSGRYWSVLTMDCRGRCVALCIPLEILSPCKYAGWVLWYVNYISIKLQEIIYLSCMTWHISKWTSIFIFYSKAFHYQLIIMTVKNPSETINVFVHRVAGLLSLLLPTITLFLQRHLEMENQGH